MINKDRLLKYQRKNRGNNKLINEIDILFRDLEDGSWKTPEELKKLRIDADCVHSDGFYFFNITDHRTMIFIMFNEEEEPECVWVGNHQEYEKTFKNNKSNIEKWLRNKEYIK